MWAWTLTSALWLAGCGGFMPITEDFTLCYDHVTYCSWPLQALFRFGIGRSYSCIIFCTKALWFCGLFVFFWGGGNLGTEKQKFLYLSASLLPILSAFILTAVLYSSSGIVWETALELHPLTLLAKPEDEGYIYVLCTLTAASVVAQVAIGMLWKDFLLYTWPQNQEAWAAFSVPPEAFPCREDTDT